MFTMEISYEGVKKINTDNMLTALKTAMNYEADLYYNGRLIYSSMGLTDDENREILKKYGIVRKDHPTQICWKYEDESRNITKVYIDTILFNSKNNIEGNYMQINIGDYREYKDSIELNSIAELKKYIDSNFSNIKYNDINILDFRNDSCKSYNTFNDFLI